MAEGFGMTSTTSTSPESSLDLSSSDVSSLLLVLLKLLSLDVLEFSLEVSSFSFIFLNVVCLSSQTKDA